MKRLLSSLSAVDAAPSGIEASTAHSRGRFADGDETMGAAVVAVAVAVATATAAMGVPAGAGEAEEGLVSSAGSAGPMKAAPEEGGGIGPM